MYPAFKRFPVDQIRLSASQKHKPAKFRFPEVRGMAIATRKCRSRIAGSHSHFYASRCDKCWVHNFKFNVPEANMSLHWGSGYSGFCVLLVLYNAAKNYKNIHFTQRETFNSDQILSEWPMSKQSLLDGSWTWTGGEKGTWYHVPFSINQSQLVRRKWAQYRVNEIKKRSCKPLPPDHFSKPHVFPTPSTGSQLKLRSKVSISLPCTQPSWSRCFERRSTRKKSFWKEIWFMKQNFSVSPTDEKH